VIRQHSNVLSRTFWKGDALEQVKIIPVARRRGSENRIAVRFLQIRVLDDLSRNIFASEVMIRLEEQG
jgi:hypothetical protein